MASSHTSLDALLARAEIVDLMNRYAQGVDLRDWKAFRSCFADRIDVDLSSFGGSPPARIAAEDFVAGVRAGLSGFDATQHIGANHQVRLADEAAQCRCAVQASHHLGDRAFVLGGHYENDFRRTGGAWRMSGVRLLMTWHRGDRAVFDEAAARHASA